MAVVAALTVTRAYASSPPTLLVLRLDMVDTSGETPPRMAEHEQRLKPRLRRVPTGQIAFAGTVSFRDDTDEAWQHAMRFLIRDLGATVTQKPWGSLAVLPRRSFAGPGDSQCTMCRQARMRGPVPVLARCWRSSTPATGT